MNKIVNIPLFAVALVAVCMRAGKISAQMPAAIDAPGQTVVATLHAEGAQVYKCKAGTQGNRIWNVLDILAAYCGVQENRFYPRGIEARGWGMGWRHLRRALKVLKIRGPVTPGGTICLKF
jgi:hypothetical protein